MLCHPPNIDYVLHTILDAEESSDRFKVSQSLSDKSQQTLKMSSYLIWILVLLFCHLVKLIPHQTI